MSITRGGEGDEAGVKHSNAGKTPSKRVAHVLGWSCSAFLVAADSVPDQQARTLVLRHGRVSDSLRPYGK